MFAPILTSATASLGMLGGESVTAFLARQSVIGQFRRPLEQDSPLAVLMRLSATWVAIAGSQSADAGDPRYARWANRDG